MTTMTESVIKLLQRMKEVGNAHRGDTPACAYLPEPENTAAVLTGCMVTGTVHRNGKFYVVYFPCNVATQLLFDAYGTDV